MLFFKKIVNFLLKIVFLVLVISFEKVAGLPLVFFTLSIVFILREKTDIRYLLLIMSSLILAVVYSMSVVLSIVLFSYCYLLFIYGQFFTKNNFHRIIFLLFSSLLIIAVGSGVIFSLDVIVYFLISLIVSVGLVLKALLSKYGFLGNEFDAKQSFFK